MKNWLKENWFKIVIIIILISLVVSWIFFVWIRPMRVKKDCFNKSYTSGSGLSWDTKDYVYKICLHKFGL